MRDDGDMTDVAPGETGESTTSRRHVHSEFDAGTLAAAKAGRVVSVCIPARNEAGTIGPIVRTVVSELTLQGGGVDLVDEVVVIDDGSTDTTATEADAAGARVVRGATPSGGKGQAMRVGLEASTGEIVAFVDGDVANFEAHFVTGLLGPLLTDDDVTVVKGFYRRPLHDAPDGGGRVTELMARPVIDLLFPALSIIEQPLAGETAAPRWVFDKCPPADGYAVEIALLIDVASRFGVETIAQVDLGVRVHRNRPLDQLRPQATEILAASLARSLLANGN